MFYGTLRSFALSMKVKRSQFSAVALPFLFLHRLSFSFLANDGSGWRSESHTLSHVHQFTRIRCCCLQDASRLAIVGTRHSLSLVWHDTKHKQYELSSELHCITAILHLALRLLGALSDCAFDVIHLATINK